MVIIEMAVATWPPLSATRKDITEQPSAAFVLSLALKRPGFKSISERQLNRIYGEWDYPRACEVLSTNLSKT